MASKLKILFLSSWYPSELSAQNGNFVQRHAEAISKYCEISVLHCVAGSSVSEIHVKENHSRGFPEVIVYKPLSVYNPVHKLKIYCAAYEKGLIPIIKKMGEPDIIHLNVFYPAGLFAMRLKRRFNAPIVVTEHSTSLLKSRWHKLGTFQKWTIKHTAKISDVICPVSENLGESIRAFGIKKPIQVIANVVDSSLFTLRNDRSDGKFKILHVSTLDDRHKNVSGIIRVFRKLSSEHTNFHLTLIGNGFQEQHKKYSKSLGISESQITISEEAPIEQIARVMKDHDVFLLFSNYENLPCVISEAHLCGLPVVSSNVGGISEMINDTNGVLVEAGNEAELKEAIRETFENKAKFDPIQIREVATKKYSYDHVAQAYLDVYKGLLNR